MREVALTGRGWIFIVRAELLASKTVEGEHSVTVREMHTA